ncbi:Non-specific serine/threonine protein kinase [Sulfidibacter corallicola]|uniref:Tetratricopeptide repeat protein n=1 Tax=Sulfidibacter corallicola TaxID=2818388 RepID=A0A8A4THW6_SULCO|nr:serine/threonine-protein kinase [Sulfidibacter corallicola]QTD48358.1 tetratricopeptide repeat protein [Sulfidibacter corallicola]
MADAPRNRKESSPQKENLFEMPTGKASDKRGDKVRKTPLLDEDRNHHVFGDDVPTKVGSGSTENDLDPETIGSYRIVEELGRGGMGTVYLAEQTGTVTRKVALKVVHASLHHSTALARFAAERQAMARLSHPHVAQLFEAGTTAQGFPFFAMEYIEGETLARYCERRKLSVTDRLRLFTNICEGVQHAHQKGVLHRDLKPSNIMVVEHEGQVVPKIIDFGIAKAIDHPLVDHTLTRGGILGTPAYMSPEALQSPELVDTRSDVYSLGLVLYELLAGIGPKREFVGPIPKPMHSGEIKGPSTRVSDLENASLEKIAGERGLSPSAFVNTLKGDLDWITLTAIDPDPDRRYGSAAELAADIERYLSHYPIQARPPRLTYQLAKYLYRYRVGVVAGTVALLALIAGVIGTSAGMIKAQRAELEARLQARRANSEAEAATQISDFLTELFTLSDPSEARTEELTVRELLDRSAANMATKLGDQPVIKARLLQAMGEVYSNLSLYKEAEGQFEQAVALREAEFGEHPDLAASLIWLGSTNNSLNRLDKAQSLFERSMAMAESLEGPESLLVVNSLVGLASIAVNRGQYREGEKIHRKALSICERAVGDDHWETATVMRSLALNLEVLGRTEEALAYRKKYLLIVEKSKGKDSYHSIRGHYTVGYSLLRLNRLEEAEQYLQKALRLAETQLEPGHGYILRALWNFGDLRYVQKRYREAEEFYGQALRSVEISLPRGHPEQIVLLGRQGHAILNQGRIKDAEKPFETALQLAKEADDTLTLVWSHYDLSATGRMKGDFDQAETHLAKARELWIAQVGPEALEIGFADFYLANIRRDQGRYREAEALYLQSFALYEKNKANPDDLAELAGEYADLLRMMDRDEEAESLLARYPNP